MSWPTDAQLQYWASVITIVGLPIAVFAFLASWRQLTLSKKAGSVAALVALHDSFRDCWNTYLLSDGTRQKLAFGDLSNTLEIACGAFADGTLFGESAVILETLLLDYLKTIEQNDEARTELLRLLTGPETFRNIRIFLQRHRTKFGQLGKV